jgi:hypothetical protein
MFENKVLRRIHKPKRDEMTGSWRKLHNKEPHNLHSSSGIIRMVKLRMRWAGYIARIWEEKKNAYRLLMGKLEGKGPPGRPRCRWMDNIEMDLGEIGWGGIDWIDWLRIGTSGGLL